MPESEPADGGERERIMAAAWDVLGRTSYDNLKIQAVIRVASVSIGRFYRHFTGKEELVAELLRAELRRATAILDELTASGAPEDRVRAWVDGVVSLAYGRHAGPRARWFTSLPNEVLARLDGSSREYRTSAPLEEAIAAGRASGVFPAAQPRRDALLIQSLCSSLDRGAVDWLGERREDGVARVADFVLAALTNPARHAGRAVP
jgi:AcrR family transcriptional regulator